MEKYRQDRELYTCKNCNTPLATKKGNSFFVMKKASGKVISVELEIQNPVGSPVRLACGKCRQTSTIFVTLRAKPKRK